MNAEFVALGSDSSVAETEKREALERLLKSRTFERSEQLRAFLMYICEAEIEGHAQDLNEYSIGVVALGRPEGYSPAADSGVRTRAHELRSRLRSYYEVEAPRERVRIEIAKGAYVPRFTPAEAPSARAAPTDVSPLQTAELQALWESEVNASGGGQNTMHGGSSGGVSGSAATAAGGTPGVMGVDSAPLASDATTGGRAPTAGTASAEGGAAAASAAAVLGLDGFLYKGQCNGGTASFECPLDHCEGNVFRAMSSFQVDGEAGAFYRVSIHVYGVVELRSDYAGRTRRQGLSSNADSAADFWYEGGAYTPGAGYNVYSLRVTPAADGVAAAADGGNNYFLNARDGSGKGHEVWALDYVANVANAGSGADGALIVALDDADPAASQLQQPLSTGGRNGQWIYIDVLDVALMDEPNPALDGP